MRITVPRRFEVSQVWSCPEHHQRYRYSDEWKTWKLVEFATHPSAAGGSRYGDVIGCDCKVPCEPLANSAARWIMSVENVDRLQSVIEPCPCGGSAFTVCHAVMESLHLQCNACGNVFLVDWRAMEQRIKRVEARRKWRVDLEMGMRRQRQQEAEADRLLRAFRERETDFEVELARRVEREKERIRRELKAELDSIWTHYQACKSAIPKQASFVLGKTKKGE